jgi:hypothetical protein
MRACWCKVIVCGLIAAACCEEATASPSAAGGELARLARALEGAYRPLSDRDLASAGAALTLAQTDLNRFLARDPQQATAWRTFLELPRLEQELARGSDADLAVLQGLLAKARGNHEGLELPVMARYRAALVNFIEVAQVVREPLAAEAWETQRQEIAAVAEQYEQRPTAARQSELVNQLAWLHSVRQGDELLRAAERRFASPNAVISISASVISTWSVEEVDRPTEINEVEDKQRTFGVGRLQGRAAAYPVPGDSGQGRLEMRFNGTLRTRVTTLQDPVRIQSHGVAPVVARKPVVLTEHGLVAGPTCSRVCYNNLVDCIGTKLKIRVADSLVTKLAGGYVERNEAEIEADASRSAEQEFNAEFDEDVAEQLRDANNSLTEKFRKPLLRQDLYPRQFVFRTTHEALDAELRYDAPGHPAAPAPPPPLQSGWDLGIRLHESSINNLGHTLLGGRTYSVQQFETMFNETLAQFGLDRDDVGTSDESGESEADLPPGEIGIEFDRAMPLQVQFIGDVATLTVRGRRYLYEDRAYPPMNIIIRYRLQNDEGVLRAVLVGEPEYVAPPGVGGLRVIALRRILRSHITPRIEKEIVQREIHLPDSDGEDEIGALDVHQVAADNGWMTVSLRRRNRTDGDSLATR